MSITSYINIFWFRRDLRFEDNTALYYALKSGEEVLPIFIFDKDLLDDIEDQSDARLTFIFNQLSKLNKSLLQYESSIQIIYNNPLSAFKFLLKKYRVKAVFLNDEYEPYTISRDKTLKDFLDLNGVEFNCYKDHVIFQKNDILNNSGLPFKVYSAYRKKWINNFEKSMTRSLPTEKSLHNCYKGPVRNIFRLEDIGLREKKILFPLKTFDLNRIQNYSQKRDFPYLDNTTRLGVHLRYGTISIRKAFNVGFRYSQTWVDQLIWREFYSMILFHFPHVVTSSFKIKYDKIDWINNSEDFEKWCNGKTGYPIVDAGMRQLNTTGFMHNRVRMITASFLTKHLLIDWRWGEAYFAKKLLDYELASNNGSWQWVAGTGTDAQPYFRIFNPSAQAKKFDPENIYITKWLPEYPDNNYPKPIIEHTFARQRAINTYKKALL